MSDAPERIWAWSWALPTPSKHNGRKEWADRKPIFNAAHGNTTPIEYVRSDLFTALQAERDAALSKVDFYEQKDGMGGAVVHAIREILNAHNVPKAAFIDDHVANALVQRDAWKARAEATEAALILAKVGLVLARDELDQYSRQEYPLDHPVHERYRQRDYEANPARLALDAITPPADLAKGVADD